MPRRTVREALVALNLLAHAWYAVKPRTRAEAVSCNAQLRRVRDFLMHEEATPLADGDGGVSAEEFQAGRAEALAQMRRGCGACGLCAQHGVPLP